MAADDPDLVPAIHPGEFVWEDVLTPLKLDVRTAAEKMGLDVVYLQALVEQRAPMTVEAAEALGRLAGNGPSLWIALQNLFDKWQSKESSETSSPKMKVNFDDTIGNWRLWGELVELWICGIHPLPKNVQDLVYQAIAHGITNASVPGPQDRAVKFYWHDDAAGLIFMLPSENMLREARSTVKRGPYPLPAFYDDAFGRARHELNADQVSLFVSCRLGEFVINNGN